MTWLRWILLPPIVFLAVVLAVANRKTVTLSFDPFNSVQPAFGIDMPLALLVFIGIVFGILIGGMASWMQSRRRRAARKTLPSSPPETGTAQKHTLLTPPTP